MASLITTTIVVYFLSSILIITTTCTAFHIQVVPQRRLAFKIISNGCSKRQLSQHHYYTCNKYQNQRKHENNYGSSIFQYLNADTSNDNDSNYVNNLDIEHKPNQHKRPRIPILQYHNNYVIISKPFGMTVHPTYDSKQNRHKRSQKQLVVSTLLRKQLSRKVFPVHRLDHKTSGIMIFAFDSYSCGILHSCLRYKGLDDGDEVTLQNDQVMDDEEEDDDSKEPARKEYIALLRGDWTWHYDKDEVVTVDKPLVDPKTNITKSAITEFRFLASFIDDKLVFNTNTTTSTITDMSTSSSNPESSFKYNPSACTLVLCTPRTGRTHQIRRHAFSIGYPIIGDTQYGDTKINRFWRINYNLDRLFLHAFSLDLPNLFLDDPSQSNLDENDSNKRINCIAPLPIELMNVLKQEKLVQFWNDAVVNDERLLLEPYDERGGSFGRNFNKDKKMSNQINIKT